jgi:hypothetical protein
MKKTVYLTAWPDYEKGTPAQYSTTPPEPTATLRGNAQWLLADALATPIVGFPSWGKMEGGWRQTNGSMTEAQASALAAELERAEIHAIAMCDGDAWWVEADVDSRDSYAMPRVERDALASAMLEAVAAAVASSPGASA